MATDSMAEIVRLTTQINALQQVMSTTTEPAAKSIISAQLAVLTAQLTSTAQHAQAQIDNSNSIIENLGLFSTLSSLVGQSAPSIIAMIRK